MISEIAKWFIIGMMVIGALATISFIGKPRAPITPTLAVRVVIANAVYIVAMILWWH